MTLKHLFINIFGLLLIANCYADENYPQKLRQVLKLKEEGKELDPVLRYEAIMDTYQAGLSYKNSGDSARALKLLKVGLSSFPFDSRIKKAFDETLSDYVNKLNRFIASGKMDCGVIEERVKFLSKVSPDSLEKIKKGSCKDFLLQKESLGKDILDRKFLDISIPRQISGANIKEMESGEEGLLSRINKEEAFNKMSDKVYKLEFPKHHILANGLKYIGVFSLKASTKDMQFMKNPQGTYTLAGKAQFERAHDEITYEGLCRNIKPFFELKHMGSVVIDGSMPCGFFGRKVPSRLKTALMTGHKDVDGITINVMQGGMKHLKGKKAPFNGFLPRFLVMDAYLHRQSGTEKLELIYEVKDPQAFILWYDLLEFVDDYGRGNKIADRSGKIWGGEPPVQIIGKKSVLISPLRGATLALNITKQEAEGLKEIELVFNRKKTYEFITSLW